MADEEKRLKALSEYALSGQSLPSLERVARIAARMFDMPVAAVNIIGNDHVFLAASGGLDLKETDRRIRRPGLFVSPST
ncbi:hypothetical protein [Caballeronia sp. LZ035]|uniref:hypothetical protein n=1 Tax=Caballeronia sp. LZ035 TaxID=3038568 RepID=UPI00286649FC|nr:hypothetical protein [Caballeronia sp. LZ035]MDR5763283.1 hypothetical protein [Caballeronia sp. LZ035]